MKSEVDYELMQRLQQRFMAAVVVLMVPGIVLSGGLFAHSAADGAVLVPFAASLIFLAYGLWACGGPKGYREQYRIAVGKK